MGKLHKGLNEFQGCASSISTKYQTIIISKEEKKGFSSQSKRFQDHLNPGPGSYISRAPAEGCSPSFSKRGTGSFASKAGHVARSFQRLSPGPDAYNLQTSLLHKHEFNRGESRMFRLPVAVSYSAVDKNSTVSAQSAFCSKTRRSASVSDIFKGPSPYLQCKLLKHFSNSEVSLLNLCRRRHYLVLSAPPLIPTKDPPFPGPGHYNIGNLNPSAKHLVSSAAFLSGTSRWIQDVKGQDIPAPGFYEPTVLSKISFLYNPAKIWIPA
uniref:Sperm-tail PG-rich repeat containing 1 n=1 Tax=Cyprinus carpio carpio TaxID=630221 RepID=A0A8C1DH81_CYPCA